MIHDRLKIKILIMCVFLMTILAGCKTRQDTEANRVYQSEEHPVITSEQIRSLTIEKEGDIIFDIAYQPREYKNDFDYWNILVPYQSEVVVNTEEMFHLYDTLAAMKFKDASDASEIESGIKDSKTSLSLTYLLGNNDENEKNDNIEEMKEAQVTVLIGNKDGNGNYYTALKGYEETIYQIPESIINQALQINPYDYILKISTLINIDTVSKISMKAGNDSFEMVKGDGNYTLNQVSLNEKEFNDLYINILSVYLKGEIEDKTPLTKNREPILTVEYIRTLKEDPNTTVSYYTYDDIYDTVRVNETEQFIVLKDEVNALIESLRNIVSN